MLVKSKKTKNQPKKAPKKNPENPELSPKSSEIPKSISTELSGNDATEKTVTDKEIVETKKSKVLVEAKSSSPEAAKVLPKSSTELYAKFYL